MPPYTILKIPFDQMPQNCKNVEDFIRKLLFIVKKICKTNQVALILWTKIKKKKIQFAYKPVTKTY